MVKSYNLLKRKPGFTQDEFLRHWREKHGQLAARLIPGLRRCVQGHAVSLPGAEAQFDGVEELWFDNVEGLQNYLTWRQLEEAKELIEDEKGFVDRSQSVRVLAEEHVMIEG